MLTFDQTRAWFDGFTGEGIASAWDGFGRWLWTNTNQQGPAGAVRSLGGGA